MKSLKTIIFLAVLLFFSCSEKKHFQQFNELPESHQWESGSKKSYEFSIDDDTKNYTISFLFSHVYDYQFNTIPINFSIENPDGTTEKIDEDIVIRENDGTHTGNCVGDICDLQFAIKENTKLQKGNYKITISNNFNGPYLPNVIGLGIEVEKQK